MIENADVRIIEPALARSSTDARAHQMDTAEGPVQRASMRQMSMSKELAVVGRLGIGVWICRLHTKLTVSPGWSIEAKLDTESDWRRYTVRQSKRGLHTQLLLEKVQ